LLQLLGVGLEFLPQLGNLLGVLELELPDDVLVRQLRLLDLLLQRARFLPAGFQVLGLHRCGLSVFISWAGLSAAVLLRLNIATSARLCG
jgi:hypothetical protein